MKNKSPLKVVAGIIEKANHVFLVKRPPNKRDGGLWEFPGGKVEEGEDLLSALKRELKEELGIKVISADFFTSIKEERENYKLEFYFYKIYSYEGEIFLKEAKEASFFTLEEALKLPLCSPDYKLLKKLLGS